MRVDFVIVTLLSRLESKLLNALNLYSEGRAKLALRRHWNLRGRHRFIDRMKDSESLVTIVAGYKPALWNIVLPRVAAFVPGEVDVCLISAGRHLRELEDWSARYGWSYLSTAANRVALGQNLALQHHPQATRIWKLDEDIVIGDGYFQELASAFERIEEEGRWRPGAVAPVLNVNGFSYRIFLEALGLEEAYRERFGELRQACVDVAAWRDPDAAEFLWEATRPFDQVVSRFRDLPFAVSVCPHRFSIGAIFYRRGLWEEMGGWSVGATGALGAEEMDVAAFCGEHARPILVAHRVLAGHAGFYAQTERMIPLLGQRTDLRLSDV